MKRKYYILIKIFLYTSIIFTFATVFVIDKQLTNKIIYFRFDGCLLILSIATLMYSISIKQAFRISIIDKLLFFFISVIFFSAVVFNNMPANTSKLSILIILFALYLCLRLTLSNNRQSIQYSCFLIIITGLTESIWGLMQLYGFLPSQHSLFKLTGSFFNPGPYAGYLAVVFPLSLHYFLDNNKQQSEIISESTDVVNNSPNTFNIQTAIRIIIPFLKKWLYGISCFAILLVLPATMSRASWLAIIAGSTVVVIVGLQQSSATLKKYLFHGSKGLKIIIIPALCLMVASFVGMYNLKKESANGRLLTWKVSLSALVQNPLGVGLGHFPNAYGEAQTTYFASGNASEVEKHVAGNPEYGFNEFLQIAIESGIIALLLFIGLLVCAFRGLIMQKNWGAMGSLVALLVFACFSYPFSVLPFLIIFVFLLAMSTTKSTQVTKVRQINKDSTLIHSIRVICVPIGCIIITMLCIWNQYPVYEAHKQWKSHQVYYHVGMYKEVVQKYEPLYPYLSDQIKFLFEYGRSLSQSEQPEKSNAILQQATQISCDPMLYNIMGKNYQAMKEYDLAEKSFQKSSLIVPNRIYPYYLLMKLYIETGDNYKAIENAKIVLTKEPKVQSTAVKEMRIEARIIIEN